MRNFMIKRRGDQLVQKNGIWAGTIGFQCPWAHPIWSEYLVLIYDLKAEVEGNPIKFLDPSATHEFMLFALAPDVPIDFDKSMFDQKGLVPLTPANHGYQFVAESNEAAWDRINKLIDYCYVEVRPRVYKMNPDTDYQAWWDLSMKDGWSLRRVPIASSSKKG